MIRRLEIRYRNTARQTVELIRSMEVGSRNNIGQTLELIRVLELACCLEGRIGQAVEVCSGLECRAWQITVL